ncbi:MAG: N-acetylglucosamine-6-phosphate deacetylase [Lachnospiraceae bacterium]|nr:N-acetylglucosamine-6-phosphate deacetylase [Lachnospiraceae bacterium]
MRYTNALIYRSRSGFERGSFEVRDGRFAQVMFGDDITDTGEDIDLGGRCVIPGLVDIHIHGCAGADCLDEDTDGSGDMASYLASCGVTSFLPTLASASKDVLERVCETAGSPDHTSGAARSRILGLRMEGPYLSPDRKGSQNPDNLCKPNIEQFRRLNELAGGQIRMIDIAPELDGAGAFIREASRISRVSVAHTMADYETAAAAFEAGASHVTHLYNAMPGIHHRDPGVIGAASELEYVTAEIICDGIHVHPGAVRMAFKLFPGRICLISDSIRCCGMPDGEYEFGGLTVRKDSGAAYLQDGHLAGSAVDLWQCLCNAVSFGIDIADAIDAATITPAMVAGVGDRIGMILDGYYADFIVCNRDLTGPEVYLSCLR